MSFKIYTKTGDSGETSLYGGRRIPKDHIRIDAYGTLDELNAHIGLVRDQLQEEGLLQALKQIQDELFTIGSNLAADPAKDKIPLPPLPIAAITRLEQDIDRLSEALPPLRNFILPGGHPLVSQCHVARCVCRRGERLCVALHHNEPINEHILQYLNRLSDYLFVLARYVAQVMKVEEVTWQAPKT